MSDPCHGCGAWFDREPWQIKKSDFFCRPCKRAYWKEWRTKRKAEGHSVASTPRTPEKRAAYDAVYQQLPDVKARRAAQMRRYVSDPRLRKRHAARWKANGAIASGRLVRGKCEVCGSPKVHAHHDDYDRPLDVRWLCHTHHRQVHAAAKGGE